MHRFAILALSFGAWALLSIVPAAAQSRLIIQCPNGLPCHADVAGHIDAVGTARMPWVAAISAPAGVCFSMAKLSSDGPVILSAIAPNGTVFRGADGAILINPTVAGWYTVQLDTPPPGREQIFDDFLISFRETTAGCTDVTPGR